MKIVAALVLSALLMAVRLMLCGELTVEGAVYKPLPVIDPTFGKSNQVTDAFEVPPISAVNCCCSPAASVAEPGLIPMVRAGVTWTTALAAREGSATLNAVTVTGVIASMREGAV